MSTLLRAGLCSADLQLLSKLLFLLSHQPGYQSKSFDIFQEVSNNFICWNNQINKSVVLISVFDYNEIGFPLSSFSFVFNKLVEKPVYSSECMVVTQSEECSPLVTTCC